MNWKPKSLIDIRNEAQREARERQREHRETVLHQATIKGITSQRRLGYLNLGLAIFGILAGVSATIYAASLSKADNKEFVSIKFLKENYISKRQHDKEMIELLDHIYSDSLLINKKGD